MSNLAELMSTAEALGAAFRFEADDLVKGGVKVYQWGGAIVYHPS